MKTDWTRVGQLFAACVWWYVVAQSANGQRGPSDPAYPEARRFNTAEFHKGLSKRGLTRLLNLHLKEHPPADPIDAVLIQRETKLAEFSDPARNAAARMAAVNEANRLLELLIADHPDDERVRDWQLELGRSLLYVEAERFTSSLMYRGGTSADREALVKIMGRAIQVLTDLHTKLTREYNALDTLPPRRYDRLEATGAIEQIESDLAKSQYMLAWCRFYRAASLDADDPDRVSEARRVLEYLVDQSELLDTPHRETHFQAQALLLAGMSLRLLGEHLEARSMLGDTVGIIANITDEAERRDLAWVASVAQIETVRSFRDTGRFGEAQEALAVFRAENEKLAPHDWGLQLVAALLERSVYRSAAEQAEKEGRSSDAVALRARAVRGLTLLAVRDAASRAEIYANLYDLLGSEVRVDELEPFERGAILAGTLTESRKLARKIKSLRAMGQDALDPDIVQIQEHRAAILDRAITMAQSMAESSHAIPLHLLPEITLNLGVALFERGRRLEAAETFLKVAKEFPRFDRAEMAATYAVQLTSEMYQDSALGSRADVQQMYLDALTTLTEGFQNSESARYWQFFLAQHLVTLGEFEAAAVAYDDVANEHARYFEAKFLAAETRWQALKKIAAEQPDDLQQVSRLSTAAIRAASNAEHELSQSLQGEADAKRRAELRHLAARANLIKGEIYATPGVSRWNKALEELEQFESRFPEEASLVGRVLRVRMLALESIGRHDEASQLIPRYLKSDPAGAPATLQGLCDAIRDEIEADKRAGFARRARSRAESAVVIAEGIYDLAESQTERFDEEVRNRLRLQLAEVLLESEQFVRARDLLDICLKQDRAKYDDGQARDSRAIFAMATALYGLGQYDLALPYFNRIFRSADSGSRIWWDALLHDLRCRTALEHPPNLITKSIQQHKLYDPTMGGEDLRRQFDALLTENERR